MEAPVSAVGPSRVTLGIILLIEGWVLLFVISNHVYVSHNPPLPGLRGKLAAKLTRCRPFEGRLAGLPYAPITRTPCSLRGSVRKELRSIGQHSEEDPSAASLALRAFLDLISGDGDAARLQQAVARLEWATAKAPTI